jgi:DNA-binding CsgD family transcriptional regulator/tetratricopeptide (TPR) repeat protein
MDSGPIGRYAEVAEISALLSATSGAPAALAITGDAGIGKTVVWKHSVQIARQSTRVLACQPASAERPLAFSALDDLFAEVVDEVLPALAVPRRRAVAAALLRDVSPGRRSAAFSEANHPLPERRVLAQGTLDALRILSRSTPLVVAVDDAQWLDRPSGGVLEFCFRRLKREPVSILLTFRTCDPVPLGLDRALPPKRLRRVQLGPLGPGAIGEILRSQLGAVLPRFTLTRLYDTCGGNPFYALESARALLDQPRVPHTNEPIPIPQSLSDLVRHRVRQLAPDVRRVGQLVATSSDPQERLIRAACGDQESWAAIDQAVHAGLIERDGNVLRFTHPLLRSVLYAEMTPEQRRQAHQQLAAIAGDVEERAWHRALGADRPSEEIALVLDHAARHAASRGAPEAAAALKEQATRLTPASRPATVNSRIAQAADYHFRAGDIAHSRELIDSILAACPVGPPRASLLLRLATIHYRQSGWPLAEQTFRQAAEEAPYDPALRAHAEQELAFARMVAGDLPGASRLAKVSLRSATKAANPRLIAHSLARIALFEFLLGNGVRTELLDRAAALEASAGEEPIGRLPMLDPSLVTGLILKWCDQLGEARLRLGKRYRHALDCGDEASLPFLLYHFSQLECWAGNWEVAEEYALEAYRVVDERHQPPMRPATLYSLALVRAYRGQVQQASELACEALALCERTGNVPLAAQVAEVLGFVALSVDDYQATHSHLGHLADTAAAVGLREPSVLKFLPDEIEALAALGELETAGSLARQLEARGRSLGRPWAQAASARCHALLAAVGGHFRGAQGACEQALSHHERLPMPFELARTLLVQGTIERRARHRQAAQDSLERALAIFEQLGAPLWAAKARRELSKITTRPSEHGLTQTENHVATLVTQGLTNREIASAMFVTENTVQTHVRHIFQKFGVRSRTELAAQLLSIPVNTREAPDPLDAQQAPTQPA